MKIFLNLLPPERKHDIVKRFYWRFFLGQWFLVLLIALSAVVVMGLLYFRVQLAVRHQQAAGAAHVTTEHKAEYERYEEKFEATNKIVRRTGGFLTLHTSFSELLRQVEAVLPPNTRIEKVATQDYKIFLTGTTDTRDTFLALQENIKKNTCFKDVNTPLNNLFSETNVQFEIDFKVKEECLRGSVPKL